MAQVVLQDEEVPFQKLVDNEDAGIAVPFNFIRSVRSVGGGGGGSDAVLFTASSLPGSPSLPPTPPLAARPPRPLLHGQDTLPEAVELPDVLWCALPGEMCCPSF